MPTDWRIYGPDTVAYRLDKAEMPGFFRKEIVAGPGDFAFVIENGQMKGALTGAMEKTAGLWDSVKSIFKLGKDIEVIFVTGTEFEVTLDLAREDAGPATVAVLSADGQEVSAQCKFVLQAPASRAHDLALLMAGRRGLATWDVAEMLKSDLLARVLVPKVRQHSADELSTNNALQGELVGEVKDEFSRLFNARGLALCDFTILWGLTDEQKHSLEQQRLQRAEQAVRFMHERQVRDMERERDIEEMRLANLQALKIAQTQGDQEQKALLLAGEGRLAEMRGQQELSEAMLDAQIEEVRIGVERKRQEAALEQDRQQQMLHFERQQQDAKLRIAEAQQTAQVATEKMERLVALKIQKDEAKHLREIETLRAEAEERFRSRKLELDAEYNRLLLQHQAETKRIASTEALIAKGMEAGAVDPDVLKTFLKESTKAQALSSGTDEQTRAVAAADNADARLADYQAGEDRERAHQQQMASLSADMMQAAKQEPPAATPPAPACPGCSKPVVASSRVCPHCARALP